MYRARDRQQLAAYYLDHYGSCKLGRRCRCLDPQEPWLGRDCSNWVPAGFTTAEGHRMWVELHIPEVGEEWFKKAKLILPKP